MACLSRSSREVYFGRSQHVRGQLRFNSARCQSINPAKKGRQLGVNWKKYLLLALLSTFMPPTVLATPVRQDNPEISKRLNIPIYSWSDPSQPIKGIVVAVHGLTFYAAAFDDFARHLAEEGYAFYAADMRGFGRWKTQYKRFGGTPDIHFSQTKEDYLRIVDFLNREYPNVPIYCMGESIGANVAFWLASSRPSLVDGVIVTSPCYKRWVHPRLRWFKDFATSVWDVNKPMNLEPYINPYLSDDKSLTQACLQDNLICRQMSPVQLIKTSITNKDTLRDVKYIPQEMPILIIAGEKDAVFKTSCIPEFVDQIGSRRTSVNILNGKGHLLLEHQPVNPQIADIVDRWLNNSQCKPEAIGQVPEQ